MIIGITILSGILLGSLLAVSVCHSLCCLFFYLLSVFDYVVHVYIEKCIHISLRVQHGAKSVLSIYEVLCSVHSIRKRFISLSLYKAIICSLSPLPPFHSISKLFY